MFGTMSGVKVIFDNTHLLLSIAKWKKIDITVTAHEKRFDRGPGSWNFVFLSSKAVCARFYD